MKYLKKFESLKRLIDGGLDKNSLELIQNYCEINLAYLLDEGMTIDCTDVIDPNYGNHECQIRLVSNGLPIPVVLDHVIPFFKRIEKDYKLGYTDSYTKRNFFKFNTDFSSHEISFEELDNIEDMIMNNTSVQRNINAGYDPKIYSITFYIIEDKL
jgi:hypothetical protein